ncbi:MAG: hypothetical protein HZB62_01190 [Nitrospirae bacterium]|nr:hypothetical protein [Nitrospirota bacterium]
MIIPLFIGGVKLILIFTAGQAVHIIKAWRRNRSCCCRRRTPVLTAISARDAAKPGAASASPWTVPPQKKQRKKKSTFRFSESSELCVFSKTSGRPLDRIPVNTANNRIVILNNLPPSAAGIIIA